MPRLHPPLPPAPDDDLTDAGQALLFGEADDPDRGSASDGLVNAIRFVRLLAVIALTGMTAWTAWSALHG